jgi:hypothetical protein
VVGVVESGGRRRYGWYEQSPTEVRVSQTFNMGGWLVWAVTACAGLASGVLGWGARAFIGLPCLVGRTGDDWNGMEAGSGAVGLWKGNWGREGVVGGRGWLEKARLAAVLGVG